MDDQCMMRPFAAWSQSIAAVSILHLTVTSTTDRYDNNIILDNLDIYPTTTIATMTATTTAMADKPEDSSAVSSVSLPQTDLQPPLSIHSLLRRHCNERPFVHPLRWTNRQLGLLQCQFVVVRKPRNHKQDCRTQQQQTTGQDKPRRTTTLLHKDLTQFNLLPLSPLSLPSAHPWNVISCATHTLANFCSAQGNISPIRILAHPLYRAHPAVPGELWLDSHYQSRKHPRERLEQFPPNPRFTVLLVDCSERSCYSLACGYFRPASQHEDEPLVENICRWCFQVIPSLLVAWNRRANFFYVSL